jgi:DNA-binding NarL/FixJ family response regulator
VTTPTIRTPAGAVAKRVNYELTAREREVLSLVAGGMTDKQVAESMAVSSKTIKQHLHNIYAKLNLSRPECSPRVSAAVWLVLREQEALR